MADAIFAAIEAHEALFGWGSTLDAGTGVHSLRWLLQTPAAPLSAITASTNLEQDVRRGLEGELGQTRLLIGNWSDPELLADERFEVVVADYLLGALDAYQPYGQDLLFPRLGQVVAPGGRLYVVGLEPSPPAATEPWGELVLATERLRDAMIRLAGDRCYREFPKLWVVRALERAGFSVEASQVFPIRYGPRWIKRQLGVGRSKLARIDSDLGAALEARAAQIEELAEAAGEERAVFGEDYLVVARGPEACPSGTAGGRG
ncbi:MAG: class I SAM-dependent methyltransferase [Planctomycetes bacterium]|nr:class I SAM-dependent methyltransferase [Planctomycetota bacterium]